MTCWWRRGTNRAGTGEVDDVSARGNEYSLNVMGPGRKAYEEGSVHFFAVYLIPEDAWYILPYAALGRKTTLHFVPGGRRQKYARYRDAWHLLQGKEERIEIFACVEAGAEMDRALPESVDWVQ